jgi:histidyl-tRNA synthetase
MRSAGKAGYRWVALVDEGEAARRVVQLRDMVSGEQREVGWDELPERLVAGGNGF